MEIDLSRLPDDIAELKRLLVAADLEIGRLKVELARLKRMQFGRKSERLTRAIEQLELAIDARAEDIAACAAALPPDRGSESETTASRKPARRDLPAHLPREDVRYPSPCNCPQCGGSLRRIGEDVTESLDYVPGHFKVIRHVREAFSCRACDTVVQAPAPNHPIPRGRAGAGLVTHVIVSKIDDHLPLYRQAEIFARAGVDLKTSTLSGWIGAAAVALMPLVDLMRQEVMASDVLYGDDTPVPILAPGTGKTKTGRLWVYVRDERPHGGSRPPAAVFFATEDRKGERAAGHLKDFTGTLHADGYAGFKALYRGNRIVEAACWAHCRRKFFDVHASTQSKIAKEALDRIGELYAIEEDIKGEPPDERRRQRQEHSVSIAIELKSWAETTLPKLPGRSDLAKAFRYLLSRWPSLMRCFDDGHLSLDNNPAERALRGVAVGRKNWLFAGSDRGAERAAALYSLIESAKLNRLDTHAYLRDVLTRIADHPNKRLHELLPWNWSPAPQQADAA